MIKFWRWFLILFLMSTLTGCFYWIRAYKTYQQMDDFDQHFSITADNEFKLFFKDPILYDKDFISLSKLQPSKKTGTNWRYKFRKVDHQGNIIQPEVKFHFDLDFNKKDRLTKWTFSELFLQIAPAEFLEISIRSLGGAEINKGKRQIKANTDSIEKIDTQLPQREQVVNQLGAPLEIEYKKGRDIYLYHFQLETRDIQKGYEDRALSAVKLTFDHNTDELLKMSGRFIGLKISINYRKFVKNKQ